MVVVAVVVCGGNGGGRSGGLSLISSKPSTRFLYSAMLMNQEPYAIIP